MSFDSLHELDGLERREAWEVIADAVVDALPEFDEATPEEFGVDPVALKRLRTELLDPVALRERADSLVAALERRGFVIVRGGR